MDVRELCSDWFLSDELMLSVIMFLFSFYFIILINRLLIIVHLGGVGDERTANPAVSFIAERPLVRSLGGIFSPCRYWLSSSRILPRRH